MILERYKRETLEKKLETYKSKLHESKSKDHEKVNNIGFGYGMRSYHRLKNISFSRTENLEEKIRLIKIELYRRSQIGKGYMLSFKDFKRLCHWKETPTHWNIYWKGKKIVEQGKHDINLVDIREWYNNNFYQYEINFDV